MLDPSFFRFYEQDGLRLPSVTTILQQLPEPMFVTIWKQKIGPEKYKEEMEWYGARGSVIHLMCENHFAWANEPIPTDPELQKFVKGFHYFYTAYRHLLSPVDSEYLLEGELFSIDLGIAGRYDMICRVAGKITLIDFKTSTNSKISDGNKKKHSLQLSGYIAMWNAKHPDLQIEQAMIVMFTDSKKTGLWEVFMVSLEDLEKAWKDYRMLIVMFLIEYVPELATPERLSLISSYEICKKV
jgi:hypothetical protein